MQTCSEHLVDVFAILSKSDARGLTDNSIVIITAELECPTLVNMELPWSGACWDSFRMIPFFLTASASARTVLPNSSIGQNQPFWIYCISFSTHLQNGMGLSPFILFNSNGLDMSISRVVRYPYKTSAFFAKIDQEYVCDLTSDPLETTSIICHPVK